MSDVLIRRTGRAGRITLNRPDALNALTWDMCLEIERALDAWASDDGIALVVIDATGDRAFCAGGDIVDLYQRSRAGDLEYGRRFWTDEYRLNAKIAAYPKPYVAMMQGFDMGGGVGVSCHGAHRVVCDSSRVALPECGIGLIPDVGGTALLAAAPGHLGEYLGTTAGRLGPGDAIHVGMADHFVPYAAWPDLIAALERTGDPGVIAAAAEPAPASPLAARAGWIDAAFSAPDLGAALDRLEADDGPEAAETRKALSRVSPLAAACAFAAIRDVRAAGGGIARALEMEARFTFRAVAHTDFLEGIRALVIDKDKTPRWRHGSIREVSPEEIAFMLSPLGAEEKRAEESKT